MLPALISGGLSLLGGLFGGSSAKKAAAAQSAATIEAARTAADAQRFRPVGITTRFGSSNFQTDAQGNVIGADYNVTPDVASLRDYLISQAQGAGIRTAEGAGGAQERLFQLGEGYLAQTPDEAAQRWMEAQQKLLQPSRERAQAGLTQNLFNTGRGGVAVAQGGMMGAANTEQQALLNAQLIQDLELTTRAQEQGRAATTFGAGLFGTGLDLASGGYNPLKTQFGLAQNIEQAAQSPLDIGAQLGGRSAQAGANVGQTLFQGSTNAARAMYDANAYSPVGSAFSGLANNQQLTQGLANWMNPPQVDTSVVGYTGPGRGDWF